MSGTSTFESSSPARSHLSPITTGIPLLRRMSKRKQVKQMQRLTNHAARNPCLPHETPVTPGDLYLAETFDAAVPHYNDRNVENFSSLIKPIDDANPSNNVASNNEESPPPASAERVLTRMQQIKRNIFEGLAARNIQRLFRGFQARNQVVTSASKKPLDTSDKALVHQSNGSPLPVPNAGSHDVSASKASRGSDAETASKSIETHRNSKTLKVDDSRSQRSQSDELAMQAGTEISSRKTSDDKKEIQKSFFSRPFSLSPAVFSSISRLRSVRKKKKNKKGIKDTQRSDKSVKKKKRRARKRTPKPKHSTSHKSASGTGLTQTDKKERSPSQIAFDTTQTPRRDASSVTEATATVDRRRHAAEPKLSTVTDQPSSDSKSGIMEEEHLAVQATRNDNKREAGRVQAELAKVHEERKRNQELIRKNKEEVSRLKAEREAHQEAAQKAETEARDLDRKCDAIRAEREANDATMARLETERQQLLDSQKLSAEFARMRKTEVARLEASREAHQEAAHKAEVEACTLEKKREALETERKANETTIGKITMQRESLSKERLAHENAMEALETERNTLLLERESHEDSVRKNKEEVSRLKAELEAHQKAAQEAEAQARQLDQKCKALEAERQVNDATMARLETERTSLAEERQKYDEAARKNKEEVSRLKAEREAHQEAAQKAETEARDLDRKRDAMRAEREANDATMARLEAERKSLAEERQASDEVARANKEEAARLEAQREALAQQERRVNASTEETMDAKRVRKAQAPVAEAPAVPAPAVAATVGAEARDNDTKVEETASDAKLDMASTEETMDAKRVRKAQAPVAEAPAVPAPTVAATVGVEARDNDTKVEETASDAKAGMLTQHQVASTEDQKSAKQPVALALAATVPAVTADKETKLPAVVTPAQRTTKSLIRTLTKATVALDGVLRAASMIQRLCKGYLTRKPQPERPKTAKKAPSTSLNMLNKAGMLKKCSDASARIQIQWRQNKIQSDDEYRDKRFEELFLGDSGLSQSEIADCYFLLANKADVNHTDANGYTALHRSCYHGDHLATKMLLHRKADATRRDGEGATALILAAYQGHATVARLLLQSRPHRRQRLMAATTADGCSSLFLAAQQNHLSAVKVLVNNKCNINTARIDNVTPLIVACAMAHNDIIVFLLKSKADVNITTSDGRTVQSVARNVSISSETFHMIEQLSKQHKY